MPSSQQASAVIPMLICRDGAAEIDFCVGSFGAVELSRRAASDGAVIHATLHIAGALFMVHGETELLRSRAPAVDGSSSVVIYLYVQDVDASVKRALDHGARLELAVADQLWGDRVGRIVDPSGHVWNVASHIQRASA